MQILIIEDDSEINRLLSKIVEREGYQSLQAFSGTEALLLLDKDKADVILLDLMLPGMSGEEVLRYLREEKKSEVPILIISAKQNLTEKVNLLKLGADDYITKPFEPEEVIARIEACLRRYHVVEVAMDVIQYKEISLYPNARKVMVEEQELVLTSHEFELLMLLMKNPKKAFSRENLYELVWNGGYYGENNTVNVHISNIRKKIKEKKPEADYIQTVYGFGFKME